MKTAVIYKSFFGSTAKYANWIHDRVDSDLYLMWKFPKASFDKYDTFVILSGSYGGWMPLTAFLKNNWDKLSYKQVVVISVGFRMDKDPWDISSIVKIPKEIRENIQYFKVRGHVPGEPKKTVKVENIEPIIYLLKESF